MELYKWQNSAIELFLTKKSLIIAAATGTGKTIVALELIKLLREKNPNYNFLIVCPKIVLIEQLWLPKLNEYGFTINTLGVYYGFAHEFSKITLTTISSVRNLDLDIFDVIICDECHNMMSPSLNKIVSHTFKYKLGLSASIKGKDQRHWKLIEAFDYNIFEYTVKQAIEDGIINRFNFVNVGVNILEDDIKEKYENIEKQVKNLISMCGGFDKYTSLPADNSYKKQLQSLFNQRNDLIMNYHRKVEIVADIIEKHRDKKVMVFNQYNKVASKIFWALVGREIKSEVINSTMKQDIVENALKAFNKGELNVLLTTRVLDEGFDVKGAEVCILMASNSTARQLIQRMGRVLRKKEEISTIYQIYVKDTFEENYANDKIEYVEELCETLTQEVY